MNKYNGNIKIKVLVTGLLLITGGLAFAKVTSLNVGNASNKDSVVAIEETEPKVEEATPNEGDFKIEEYNKNEAIETEKEKETEKETKEKVVEKKKEILKVIKTGRVNDETLNIREKADASSHKLKTLNRNDLVEIVEIETNGWFKVKCDNDYGYVNGKYVNIDGQITNLNNFLFIGDSFTSILSNTIKSNNDNNVFVHAKGSTAPSYWLDKVDGMPDNSKVNGVVLLIGVNGASTTANKEDVKTLIDKLVSKYKGKTVYVQKVFPTGLNFTSANPTKFNQSISTLNEIIEAHCKNYDNVKLIDTQNGFVEEGYLIKSDDGLHIAYKYNQEFYNNILNAIKNS